MTNTTENSEGHLIGGPHRYSDADPRCVLYLASPQGRAPSSTALFFHGGGWQIGEPDGEVYLELVGRLADAGVLAASVGYRLGSGPHFPGVVDDTRAAIGWMVENASRFGYEGQAPPALVGSSAGAYNVLAAALGADAPPVRSVTAIAAPTAFRKMKTPRYRQGADDPALVALLGATPTIEVAAAASPVVQVEDGCFLPPMFLVHGRRDPRVDVRFSLDLARAVRARDGSVEVATWEGGDHGLSAVPEALIQRVIDFVAREDGE